MQILMLMFLTQASFVKGNSVVAYTLSAYQAMKVP